MVTRCDGHMEPAAINLGLVHDSGFCQMHAVPNRWWNFLRLLRSCFDDDHTGPRVLGLADILKLLLADGYNESRAKAVPLPENIRAAIHFMSVLGRLKGPLFLQFPEPRHHLRARPAALGKQNIDHSVTSLDFLATVAHYAPKCTPQVLNSTIKYATNFPNDPEVTELVEAIVHCDRKGACGFGKLLLYILRMGMNLKRQRTLSNLYRWVVAFCAEFARAKQERKVTFEGLRQPVNFDSIQILLYNIPFSRSLATTLNGFMGDAALQQHVFNTALDMWWSKTVQAELNEMPGDLLLFDSEP
jgi:hypothetical protein